MSLHTRTDQLRTLFPQVFYRGPVAVALTLLDSGTYIEVNDAWVRLLGFAREEAVGKTREQLGIWEDAEQQRLLSELVRGQGRVTNLETRGRTKPGAMIDVLLSCEILDYGGEQCALTLVHDISESKRAQQRLRLSEERFAAIFENSPLAMTVARHADGVYLQVNRAYETLLGYRREEVLGQSTLDLGVWADPGSRARMVARLERGGASTSIEAGIRRKDGSVFESIFTAAKMRLDGVEVIHGTVQDISDLRRVTRLKEQSDVRFDQMVETSPLAMTFTRLADGVYLGVNRACEKLLGYSREEMIGKSSLELNVWAEPAARDEVRRQLNGGRTVASIEAQARAKDGRLIDIFFSATVIDLDGEPVLHGTVFDLTQVKRATSDKLASEERFSKIFRASPDAIVISRAADGVYIEMNDAWQEQFGYQRDETIGRSAVELGVWVDPAERQRLLTVIHNRGTTRGFETQLRRRSGEVADVMLSVEKINVDGEDGLIICTTDVTVRRLAERLRVSSEVRFAQVFQVSPNPIVFSRAVDGRGIQVNDAWHKLFGFTAEDIRAQTSVSLNIWVDLEFRARRQKILADGGHVRDMETQMRTKAGAILDIMISSELVDLDGVPYIVSILTDVSARKSADRQIEYLATRDYLTGLPNRVLFSDRLQQALVKTGRDNTRAALLFVDLDHFKNINDTLGHQAGDHVLTEVAARLTSAVRGADTVGRQGGDEFLLLLEGLNAASDAGPVAEKLVSLLSEPVVYLGHSLRVSCSIGISVYPDDALTEAELMRNADLAMYAAKEAGRNAHRFYAAGMNQRLVERMAVEEQLRGAVERNEFVLHFQPKVHFESGLVTGCEALLRWRRGGGALVPPARFIGVAEDSGLIVAIGAWVLRETCRTLRRWLDAGLEAVPVACNVSVHQFNPRLPRQIADILQETGVPPHLLQLEITETVMMHSPAAHLQTMLELKDLGINMALDDFGTGYSSLSYLRHMDLDVLKIDRSFVSDVAGSADAQAIVSAIIAMAGKFGMKTVAEGVETPAQAEALRRIHCDEYQGFLFSAPLPVEEFASAYLLAAQGA